MKIIKIFIILVSCVLKLKTMKTIKLLLLFSLVTLFIPSCKTDLCEEVSCINGGSCEEGNCLCESGYEGDECGIEIRAKYVGEYSVDTASQYCEVDTVIPVLGVENQNISTPATIFSVVEDTDNIMGLILTDTENPSIAIKVLLNANEVGFSIPQQAVDISSYSNSQYAQNPTIRGTGSFTNNGFQATLVTEFIIDAGAVSGGIVDFVINTTCTQSNLSGTKL